jgi:hypothetical protein
MFIKNQQFSDEENLLEQLFDFGLGDAAPEVQQLMLEIDNELLHNEAFQKYRLSLTDEEEQLELDDEERRIRLAERLMAMFQTFEVNNSRLWGIKDGAKVLLYSIDLY